jgi:hypothetical protein
MRIIYYIEEGYYGLYSLCSIGMIGQEDNLHTRGTLDECVTCYEAIKEGMPEFSTRLINPFLNK